MTLEQALIKAGESTLPSEKIFVWDPIKKVMYKAEFWRLLDDPNYEEIRKQEAVEIDWRIFYLLN